MANFRYVANLRFLTLHEEYGISFKTRSIVLKSSDLKMRPGGRVEGGCVQLDCSVSN